ncbi:hypothetical protein Stsp01_65360 [Streptomyces sp. NBRC 13847]|nr:hypothetical protein Stsp01_65360 [Streptomyces sp. NBRC 13847]
MAVNETVLALIRPTPDLALLHRDPVSLASVGDQPCSAAVSRTAIAASASAAIVSGRGALTARTTTSGRRDTGSGGERAGAGGCGCFVPPSPSGVSAISGLGL